MSVLHHTIFKHIELIGPDTGGSLEGPWVVQTSMNHIVVVRTTDGVVVPWHNVGLLAPVEETEEVEVRCP